MNDNYELEIAALRAQLNAAERERDELRALWDALEGLRNVEITQDDRTWAVWDKRWIFADLLVSGKTLVDAVRAMMEESKR